jgi:hypothetical protein
LSDYYYHHRRRQGYVIASPAVDIYQPINTKVLYAYYMTLIPKELYEVIFPSFSKLSISSNYNRFVFTAKLKL